VLPWTDDVVRGMAERWPGGSGLGLVLAAAALPAAVLAVLAGRWRLVAFAAAVVLLDTAVLVAQYVVTAYGPPTDPLAGPLLEAQLQVTVSRVALVPAALLAVAVPVFAALALRPSAEPPVPTVLRRTPDEPARDPGKKAEHRVRRGVWPD
jgi:hypothetical protein